jgi:AhpD family alkylhydroperoxidase
MITATETFFDEWPASMEKMKAQAPDVVRAFGGMFQAIMKSGALGVREKELIALGIGLAVRCTGCINMHVEKCLKAGATREQILEAAGVAVLMQGGPTYMYVPEVIKAVDYLSEVALQEAH